MRDLEAPSLCLGNTLFAKNFYGFLTALSLRASRSLSLLCRPLRMGIAAAICGLLGTMAGAICPEALAQTSVTLQYDHAVSTIYTGQNLGYPHGVAVDGSGNVYTIDYVPGTALSSEVLKETLSAGSYTPSTIDIGVYGAAAIAVDGSGNLYIADSSSVYKETLSASGYTQSVVASGLNKPLGVAVDGSGNVYIADYGNNRVLKEASSAGGYAQSTIGSGLSSPWNVAVDGSGNVYIADAGNNRVLKEALSPGGYTQIVVTNDLSGPTGVAVDGSGNVYIVDTGVIVKETPSANGYTQTAITFPTNQQAAPRSVAVDGSGNVYVATEALGTSNNQILKATFSTVNFGAVQLGGASGTVSLVFSSNTTHALGDSTLQVLSQGATGLDFADAGTVDCDIQGSVVWENYAYATSELFCTENVTFTPKVLGQRNGSVVFKDAFGNTVTVPIQGTGIPQGAATQSGPQVSFVPGTQTAVATNASPFGLSNPEGVAVDGSGNVYVADTGNNRVLKETQSAGSYTQTVIANATTNGLLGPVGVAVDGNGNVYIADTGNNRVLKETLSAGSYTQSTVASGLNKPAGVAVDGSGNVYIADSFDSLVLKETLSAASYTRSTISFTVPGPTGVAVDGSGNVYVTDGTDQRLLKETPSGSGYTESTIDHGLGGGVTGVAVDGNGNLYVADPQFNRVVKETLSAGVYTPSTIVSEIYYPYGAAVDGNGNVYFAVSYPGFPQYSSVLKENFSSPPSLIFASTAVGSTSTDSPHTLTVQNTGTSALTFLTPPSGNNPSISANFSLGSLTTCPTLSSSSSPGTLAPGASCVYSISFSPTTAGSISGSLVLTDNSLNATNPYATQIIALSGTGAGQGQAPTATPTFSVAGGTYAAAQTVTISDATAGATIYYTTNGTTPTTSSTKYTSGITVSSSETLEAIATVSGSSISAVATATFAITAATGTLEWTWVGGSSTGNPSGVYGTLGTFAVGNVPGGRTYSASWTDAAGNFWLFGGLGNDAVGNYNNLNDLWKFNSSTNQWAWISGSSTVPATANGNGGRTGVYGTLGTPAAGNVPGSRRLSSSWTDSSGHLWLFGGYGYDSKGNAGDLNDLWEFNPSTNQWAWVSGSNTVPVTTNANGGQPGVYGTLGTPAAANVPGGRVGASSWTDNGGHLWLFGGSGYDSKGITSGDLSDLWEFNPSINQWTWMSGSNTTGHSGVYGTLGTPAAGNVPGSRDGAMSWTDNIGHLWLFGGEGYDANGSVGDLNDLWEFNPSTNQWVWLSGSSTEGVNGGQSGVYGTLGTPAAGNVPGGRRWASTWNDGSGHLWLFGGSGYDVGKGGGLNDLWEFNPSTSQWAWMAGSSTVGTNCTAGICGQPGVYGTLGTSAAGNAPGGRYSASGWTDSSGNLWLFGGDGFDSTGRQNILNDLWKFQPPAPPAAATPTFSVPAGTYATAQTVTISDATAGAIIYYTTNGTTPTTSSTKYTSAITVSSSETLEAIATASGVSASAVATAAFTIGATAPAVTLSVTSLTFASQADGTTSAAQTVTLTNSGTAALSITSIAASGDFAQTNTCGTTVTAGAACTISVTFTPTAAGSRTGTLTITDNASGSPQTVALSGGGEAVSLSTTSTGLTVASAGGSATATIQLSPQGGFTGTVNLTCAVTYQGQGTPNSPPTCSLNPSQAQVTGNSPISSTLTVSTTAASASATPERIFDKYRLVLAALLFLGVLPRRRWRGGLLFAVLCSVTLCGTFGCSGSSAGANSTPPSTSGTTTGNYQVAVTAKSGTVTTSTTIPLLLQ